MYHEVFFWLFLLFSWVLLKVVLQAEGYKSDKLIAP